MLSDPRRRERYDNGVDEDGQTDGSGMGGMGGMAEMMNMFGGMGGMGGGAGPSGGGSPGEASGGGKKGKKGGTEGIKSKRVEGARLDGSGMERIVVGRGVGRRVRGEVRWLVALLT